MWRIFSARTRGRVGVARLQRRDHAAGFVAQRTRLVERGVVARAHEAAVALEMRKLVGERRRELGGDRGVGPAQRPRRLRELGGEVRRSSSSAAKPAAASDAVADGGEVARPAAADHEPRQRAGEIGRRREARAHVGARRRVGNEEFDRVVPPRRSPPDR